LYLKTFEQRARFVERFVGRRGRVLDVGCAAGFFMRVMHERGWEVDGVEPSPEIAAHATEAYGFHQLHVGELQTAPFDEGSFDLITLWDVVEHVPDPKALLRRAVSLLRDDGRLVVETQNVASPFARLLGRRWQHYKHMEHLYHFRPETLEELFKQSGLEMVDRTWRHAGKYVSLGFVRERAARLNVFLSRLLRYLAPLDQLSAYVNPADEIIAVARKARAVGVPEG
jgi:2-polyprenyl-3-methyl-5-hydroxy-6-metoxy-1,4-benzoquinol methylase